MEEIMADREVIHTNSDSGGMGGMGAILGMILGVLLVGGLIFFFAGGNFDRGSNTKLTVNTPSTTTGSAPSAPANPAR
jgi:hypothetical protein